MAYADYLDSVQKIYMAFYQRPADPAGLVYWAQRIDAAGGDLSAVINAFATSTEATTLYGAIDSTTIGSVIDAIYQALFNRTPDEAGKAYYVDGFAAGRFTAGSITLDILNGAQNDDSVAISNKLEAANFFTKALDPEMDGIGPFQATYDANDEAAARTWMAGITYDPATRVTEGEVTTAIKTQIADEGDPIMDVTEGYTLTNGTDVASSNIFNSNLVYTPGGDDRINSLQDEDILTGSGTNPTLNATLGNANDNGATVITPKLVGIETINAAFTGSGLTAVTALDLQDATGLKTINITRVSQAINFAEVGNITTAVETMSLANTNANQAGVVEFSFVAGVLKGDNTATMTVTNVDLGNLNIGRNTSGINAAGVNLEGYEHLTLHSTGGANTIGTLNLPMDTGTAGTLTITGDADLTLGTTVDVVNAGNNALIEAANVWVNGTGLALAGGRIATIDASALEGNFTIVLDNLLDVGKAETSGVQQDVSVIGGAGDDLFVLYDVVQAGDSLDGGEGTDTLLFYSGSGLNSTAANIDHATMLADGSINPLISVDFDFLPNAAGMTVRNIGSDVDVANYGGDGVPENAADPAVVFQLLDLTSDQAANIAIQHATTGNGDIADSTIEAAVAANTASDTLGVAITEGTNIDPRFNFTIDTVVANTTTAANAALSTFENLTFADNDSESNSVELNNFAQHTGTITIAGGTDGTFLNFDIDTAGADVTAVTTGATADGGEVQQGLYALATDGTAVDFAAGNIINVGTLATQVRLGAATIDASAEASDVIVRVSTNAASATGAQTILMGSGDDTVIFDMLSESHAGLTISDTVTGGEGSDTLAIDGEGVRVSLGASEWTNVSGFETIRLVGNATVAAGTQIGQNSYNLALTNDLIDANGGNIIAIINDNDSSNDAALGANTASTGAESAVTIDARTLDASNHFSYNGEENAGITVDKFIFADANINGGNIIDGGAVDNDGVTTWAANADIMEVRNTATVTVGDLANISNVGIIAGSNDQAVEQTLHLQLNDTVVDALVDSYHTSTSTEAELLTVRLNDAADVTTPAAGMGLDLDASALTARSQVNIALDTAVGATDSITIGFGNLTVTGFATGTDKVVLDVSTLGLALDADDIGVAIGTNTGGDGSNIETGVAAATAATTRIIIDDTGVNLDIYYDSDGNGAQAQVLLASLTGVGAYAAGDFILVA